MVPSGRVNTDKSISNQLVNDEGLGCGLSSCIYNEDGNANQLTVFRHLSNHFQLEMILIMFAAVAE